MSATNNSNNNHKLELACSEGFKTIKMKRRQRMTDNLDNVIDRLFEPEYEEETTESNNNSLF